MANFKKHTVKAGESLLDIAKTYGVPIDAIKRANNVEMVEEGQTLTIPIKHNAAPSDTPESVAKQYGVPEANVQATTEQRFIVRPPVVFSEYALHPGETLAAVADKFGLDPQFIAEANGTETPRSGQILTIPIKHSIQLDEPTEEVARLYRVPANKVVPISNYAVVIPPKTEAVFPRHLVQPGETIASIAQKYNIPAKYIAQANGVDIPNLGQIISIPLRYNPEMSESPRSVSALYDVAVDRVLETDNIVLPPAHFIEHVVHEGETVNEIAQKYEVEAKLIVEANNVTLLRPGQILVLPVKYAVKMNDTSGSVGRRYGVPADNVIKINDVTLVKPVPSRFPRHLMQMGETLASIAEKYGVEPAELAEANHTDAPQRGQILTVPVVRPAQPSDSVSTLASEYGVAPDNVTQMNDRIFIVRPTARRPISPVPIFLGLAALLLLVLIAVLLYRFVPIGSVQRFLPAEPVQLLPGQRAAIEINAPPDETTVLPGAPVQVLSQVNQRDLARVELLVSKNGQNETLIRADIPQDGHALQPWQPTEEGEYRLTVRAVNLNNAVVATDTTVVQVQANPAIQRPQPQVSSSGTPQLASGEAFQPPPGATPAPLPGEQSIQPQAACSAFNAPGAPTIRTLRVLGVEDGEVSRAANAPVKPVTIGLGNDLAVEWKIEGSNRVEFLVTNDSRGETTTENFESGAGLLHVSLPDIGTYRVLMRAYTSGECQALQASVEKQVLVVTVEGKVIEAAAVSTLAIPPTPTNTPEPTPTPTRFFPPPPPAPGVPLGPTQDQLPELHPPVCDAAELLGVYTPSTSQRIDIQEEDMIPAKTVGGSTVFRAWRLQNTGTCTWGPGYELAFYGGRSMGSGGVTFENTWPSEPGRRNIVIDGNRLVVPQGKPNQVAVVEVMLQAPVTPGIHQSYWRMRNPQGVYFGPIMGVTLEVVRDCQSGIYGAPTINKFEILGVGDVYRPVNPISVDAERGKPVTLDWDVINATNVDVVIDSPTHEIKTLSSGDPSDRTTFTCDELGTYDLTLYADNGACTVPASVKVECIPAQDNPNAFIMTAQQTTNISEVQIEWSHEDPKANVFELYGQTFQKITKSSCLLGSYTPNALKSTMCTESSTWKEVPGASMPIALYAVTSGDVIGIERPVPALTPADEAVYMPPSQISGAASGGAVYHRGSFTQLDSERPLAWQSRNKGKVNVANTLWGLCPKDPNGDYRVVFGLRAGNASSQAVTPQKNTNTSLQQVSVSCDPYSKQTTTAPRPVITSTPPVVFPREIPDDSAQP